MTEAEDFEFKVPKQNISTLIKLKEMQAICRLPKHTFYFQRKAKTSMQMQAQKTLENNSYEVMNIFNCRLDS